MFSGGSYDEVARWLKMFLNSHAKREQPRVEAALEDDERRENVSYAARLVLGERKSPVMEFDYKIVGRASRRARVVHGPRAARPT